MIRHIKGSAVKLDLHPADERHIGEMENRWTHAYTNESLLLEVGYSEFRGDMRIPPLSGFDLVAVVLSGQGSIESDGTTHHFDQGDTLIYEPPIPETRLVSNGFRYAYITHWHTPEDRELHGWVAAGQPRTAGTGASPGMTQ